MNFKLKFINNKSYQNIKYIKIKNIIYYYSE